MKVHITNIYNQIGTHAISQNKVFNIAKEMGFHEMGLFFFDTSYDNDNELGKRIDGILASLQFGDIVFFQSPSWNTLRYDKRLVRQIKAYRGVKLVVFIHDVIPLMFNSGEENLRETIDIYNMADLIIAPSYEMLGFLRKQGLCVEKQMVQEVWDYPITFDLEKPTFNKRMFFVGKPGRFPFVNEWRYKTVLDLYAIAPLSGEGLNVREHGYKNEVALMIELSEGGYGLIWPSEEKNDYYSMLQPYKVGTYLAAGIPVITKKGLVPEQLIVKNGLGYVVDSLEEANEIVQKNTETEYNQMVERIAEFNGLIKNGWFTKKLFTDAIMWLLNENYMK